VELLLQSEVMYIVTFKVPVTNTSKSSVDIKIINAMQ